LSVVERQDDLRLGQHWFRIRNLFDQNQRKLVDRLTTLEGTMVLLVFIGGFLDCLGVTEVLQVHLQLGHGDLVVDLLLEHLDILS
jgi:hypothetical protein